MKLLLISDSLHNIHKSFLDRSVVTVNSKAPLSVDSAVTWISQNTMEFEAVLITEPALSQSDSDSLHALSALRKALPSADFLIITNRFYLSANLLKMGFRVVVSTSLRISSADIAAASFTPLDVPSAIQDAQMPGAVKKILRPPFNIRKKRTHPDHDDSSSAAVRAQLLMTTQKSIIFSGHRNSGITSTLINTAYAASKIGLKVFILDLDCDYRATNHYFSKLANYSNDSNSAESLMALLAKPANHKTQAVQLENNLWISNLSMSFNETELITKHFTAEKISALLVTLRNNYNLILADMPLDVLSTVTSVLNNADSVVLCVENNISAVLSTMCNLTSKFSENDIAYINSKTKLIATRYNDESMFDEEIVTAERLAEIMTDEDICSMFTEEVQVAGKVPQVTNYSAQMESDILIYESNSQMRRAFDEIVVKLMGGS